MLKHFAVVYGFIQEEVIGVKKYNSTQRTEVLTPSICMMLLKVISGLIYFKGSRRVFLMWRNLTANQNLF